MQSHSTGSQGPQEAVFGLAGSDVSTERVNGITTSQMSMLHFQLENSTLRMQPLGFRVSKRWGYRIPRSPKKKAASQNKENQDFDTSTNTEKFLFGVDCGLNRHWKDKKNNNKQLLQRDTFSHLF